MRICEVEQFCDAVLVALKEEIAEKLRDILNQYAGVLLTPELIDEIEDRVNECLKEAILE